MLSNSEKLILKNNYFPVKSKSHIFCQFYVFIFGMLLSQFFTFADKMYQFYFGRAKHKLVKENAV